MALGKALYVRLINHIATKHCGTSLPEIALGLRSLDSPVREIAVTKAVEVNEQADPVHTALKIETEGVGPGDYALASTCVSACYALYRNNPVLLANCLAGCDQEDGHPIDPLTIGDMAGIRQYVRDGIGNRYLSEAQALTAFRVVCNGVGQVEGADIDVTTL